MKFELVGLLVTIYLVCSIEAWFLKKRRRPFHFQDVRFILFTRHHKYGRPFHLGNLEDLASSGFSGDKPSRIVVHGWKDTPTGWNGWGTHMVEALLEAEDQNVWSVDWSVGASTSSYPLAVANTEHVGRAINRLVRHLERTSGLSRSRVHLIGYSLGGHCCAEAGRRLQAPKLARITGLDVPDLGVYTHDLDHTLDPSDAVFVDEVHTEFSWYNKGHADFYPNGGSRMPGCLGLWDKLITGVHKLIESRGITYDVKMAVGCDHQRAVDYYMETINPPEQCNLTVHACSSWADYQAGRCRQQPENSFGYGAQKPSGGTKMYYFETNVRAPFCSVHLKHRNLKKNIIDEQ